MPAGPFRSARVTVLLVLSVMLAATGCATDEDGGVSLLEPLGIPGGATAEAFSGGIVTAAHPLAAEAGGRVLANGGNAIDAAVVTQFVLNVVEPTSSGIGGGGFMGVHLSGGRTFFIDSREKAPAAASPTMFLQCDPNCDGTNNKTIGDFEDRATSGIAVGVPGTLLGLAHALENYGSGNYSLARALEPAIELAENGFGINARLAELTADDRTGYWDETAATFRDENDDPLAEGFLLVQPDLAKTFRLIAANGVSAFYTGPMAAAIALAQERSRETVGTPGKGRMVKQDLQDYLEAGIVERDAVMANYRGYTIAGMPSPSSGGNTVGQILACLEQFPLGNERRGFGEGALNTVNAMAESMRLAFSSRSVWMGDADFVELPDEGLLAAGYLKPRCEQISATARLDEPRPGDPRPFDPDFDIDRAADIASGEEGEVGIDTTHFSVIDGDGNVVSYTSTIEGTWGSGITVPGYGFLLNNELTDFNSEPMANDNPGAYDPGANDVAAGKRPRSSMSPSIVFDGDELLAAYGSPGGSTIINTVVNMTVNLIDHRMSVQEAIDAPRLHTSGGAISLEPGFDLRVIDGLEALGHEVNVSDFGDAAEPYVQGSVQAIVVDPNTGLRYGGADSRRAGTVTGTQSTAAAGQ